MLPALRQPLAAVFAPVFVQGAHAPFFAAQFQVDLFIEGRRDILVSGGEGFRHRAGEIRNAQEVFLSFLHQFLEAKTGRRRTGLTGHLAPVSRKAGLSRTATG